MGIKVKVLVLVSGTSLLITIPVVAIQSLYGMAYALAVLALALAAGIGAVWALTRRIMKPLDEITRQIKQLGDGDLMPGGDFEYSGEFGTLQKTLNNSAQKLREAMLNVNTDSENLSGSSVRLASISDEVNRAVETIAKANVEIAEGAVRIGNMANEAAESTDGVVALVKTTSDEMKAVMDNAREIELAAGSGRDAIDEATSVINDLAAAIRDNAGLAVELGDKSKKVSDIVGLINGIAAQTNLLSLNAAIEAARAGTYGQGFAVVADEVRKLAEQSKEAAGQIGKLISSMLADIDKVVKAFESTNSAIEGGVKAVGAANLSFAGINDNIASTFNKIKAVAELADNQDKTSSAMKEIVHNVADIAVKLTDTTQTTAAASQEITASFSDIAKDARHFSSLAGELQRVVLNFKISDKKIIRVAFGMTDKSPSYAGMKRFAELVRDRSEGRYEVKIFHSSQLGEDIELMKKLKAGSLEMCFPANASISTFDKRYMLLDFPFIFKDENTAFKVLNGSFGGKMLELLNDNGLHGLAFAENGYRELTNSRREITRIEDFKGLKIRTMENPVHMDVFRALGAETVPMPFGQVYNALELKNADGQENSIPTIYSGAFYEVQSYLTLTHHLYGLLVLMYSKELWDKLPAEDRRMIAQAARDSALYTTQINQQQTRQLLPELEARGMKISMLSPGEVSRIQNVIKPVLDRYKDAVGKELFEELFRQIS